MPKSKDHTSAGSAENYRLKTSSLEDFFPIFPSTSSSSISSDSENDTIPKVDIEATASDKSENEQIKKSITVSKVPKSKDYNSADSHGGNYRSKNTRTTGIFGNLEDLISSPIPPKIPTSPISKQSTKCLIRN